MSIDHETDQSMFVKFTGVPPEKSEPLRTLLRGLKTREVFWFWHFEGQHDDPGHVWTSKQIELVDILEWVMVPNKISGDSLTIKIKIPRVHKCFRASERPVGMVADGDFYPNIPLIFRKIESLLGRQQCCCDNFGDEGCYEPPKKA